MVLRDQADSITTVIDIIWMARMTVTRMETPSISDRAIGVTGMRMNGCRYEREKGKQADLVLLYSPILSFLRRIVLSVSELPCSVCGLPYRLAPRL
jgi:hypothetical protein